MKLLVTLLVLLFLLAKAYDDTNFQVKVPNNGVTQVSYSLTSPFMMKATDTFGSSCWIGNLNYDPILLMHHVCSFF
jgi:hypothetical protein